jgi:NADPH:quinone reductase-like Zn-dependent oxidoreductase
MHTEDIYLAELKGMMGEAHLPQLGLSIRWEATKEKHAKIAFDPVSGKSVDLSAQKVVEGHVSLGVIKATEGQCSMPVDVETYRAVSKEVKQETTSWARQRMQKTCRESKT